MTRVVVWRPERVQPDGAYPLTLAAIERLEHGVEAARGEGPMLDHPAQIRQARIARLRLAKG